MSVLDRIDKFNAGRDPERLAIKYAKMARDELGFFRGSAHLFYEDLGGDLPDAPLAWLCGDLHLENFGSYRADNRLSYFDFNDFDEACLGPLTADWVRLLTSVVLESWERGHRARDTRDLAKRVTANYAATLKSGKARWLERATASGLILELLSSLEHRSQTKFLASRSVLEGRKRKLLVDGKKALPADPGERKQMERFARKQLQGFRLIDVARRIAGNGSLGVPRYVLLVESNEDERHLLLDLKQAQQPVGPRYHRWKQPAWEHDAHRVAAVQELMQAVPVAFLRAVRFEGTSWVLRELVPQEDRVDVAQASDRNFTQFAQTLGCVVAWGAIRASGRFGAATADELVEFGALEKWRPVVLEIALDMAAKTRTYFREFRKEHGGEMGS